MDRAEGLPIAEDWSAQSGINEGISQGSYEGSEGGDDPWIFQGTDMADDGGDIQEAFWRLLHNACYDTW